MPKWFKTWWPVVVAVVPALWAGFTYFDGQKRNPAPSDTTPIATAPQPPAPTVSANGGIAVGGNVTDSVLKVDASRK